METDIKIKVCISEISEAEGSRELSAVNTAAGSYDRALVSSRESAAAAGDIAIFRKRKKLSGAARKRARKERERAARAAQSLCSAIVPQASSGRCGVRQGVKRPVSFDGAPPSVDRVCKKLRLQDTGTCVSRAVPQTMAIVTESYPEEVITAEGLTLLREAFCKEIHEIQEGFVPRFLGTSMLRNGAVIIKCADEVSLDWLTERIGHISPWEGAVLKVVGLEALRQYKAVAWIPGPPVPLEKIMALLEKQNLGLRTSSWQMLAEYVTASGNGRNVIFNIPESSVLYLRALNFKLFCGLEQIVITVKGEI